MFVPMVLTNLFRLNRKHHSTSNWFCGKKWKGPYYIMVTFVLVLFVAKCKMIESPIASQYLYGFFTNASSEHIHLKNLDIEPKSTARNPDSSSRVVSYDELVSGLSVNKNLSKDEKSALQIWKYSKSLIAHPHGLPHAVEAIKEAKFAWETLMTSVEERGQQFHGVNGSSGQKGKDRLCPYSLSEMHATKLYASDFKLQIPCGLVQGSSVTIIGTPLGILGSFQINLRGTALPGEPDPPIILHYNVRLHGDKLTENPVIIQNTWTAANEWGQEERCPSDNAGKVDELEQCNHLVGKENKRKLALSNYHNSSKKYLDSHSSNDSRRYFPFTQGYPSVATLRVGLEGIQMAVDGKHITSFAYRESLEPWLVNGVRISGDLKLISILATGLPSSEDVDHVVDLNILKAVKLPPKQKLDLLVGVFSTANNFKRRMAVRRTWMQYDSVRNGRVAVRFFVGLHTNNVVNEELWEEARTYGDTQLMPFVDYYSLITWKSIAICMYGTKIVNAKYIMKTDDDAFVRVDEILTSLNRTKIMQGLLYGLMNYDSSPHRDPNSKWYISPEEWPEDTYPPWAHGPGYIVSHDIADLVVQNHKNGRLKMFKLEDVAMGMWIADMKKGGLNVQYVNEEKIYNTGCGDGYIVAHYQEPREMLCLWQKLAEGRGPECCN